MTAPSVFGLPHLSEDSVAAFADGVLSAPAAARAQRHCAECAECAEAVRGQREAAMMLRTSGVPALPAGLLDRLAGLPMSASLPPRFGGLPTVIGSDGVPMFIAHSPKAKPAAEPDPQPEDGQAEFAVTVPLAAMPARRPGGASDGGRFGHRRVLLPVGIFASAAAVVAAGTLGGSTSSLRPVIDQPAAVNLAPGLVADPADRTAARTAGQPGTENLPAAGRPAALNRPAVLVSGQPGRLADPGSAAPPITP